MAVSYLGSIGVIRKPGNKAERVSEASLPENLLSSLMNREFTEFINESSRIPSALFLPNDERQATLSAYKLASGVTYKECLQISGLTPCPCRGQTNPDSTHLNRRRSSPCTRTPWSPLKINPLFLRELQTCVRPATGFPLCHKSLQLTVRY